MRTPTMQCTIDRRILVSYAIDPEVLAPMLPSPLRPTVHNGVAVGGICLIRMTDLRPRGVPRRLGMTTENVAHRFAVAWDGPADVEQGVYIPRRDTSSLSAALGGGRLFPGVLAHGRFDVADDGAEVRMRYASDDRLVRVDVRATTTDHLPSTSLFQSVDDASEFFRRAPVGWSPSRQGCACEAVELHADDWAVTPLALTSVRSSWFDDPAKFPPGSINLDSALVMRVIAATWAAAGDAGLARAGAR